MPNVLSDEYIDKFVFVLYLVEIRFLFGEFTLLDDHPKIDIS